MVAHNIACLPTITRVLPRLCVDAQRLSALDVQECALAPNFVDAQNSAWQPTKIVVAQRLPETWESIRCLDAQNFMGERGQMWE